MPHTQLAQYQMPRNSVNPPHAGINPPPASSTQQGVQMTELVAAAASLVQRGNKCEGE
jgi:hypothetical protein